MCPWSMLTVELTFIDVLMTKVRIFCYGASLTPWQPERPEGKAERTGRDIREGSMGCLLFGEPTPRNAWC
jgi:hypothetical protein